MKKIIKFSQKEIQYHDLNQHFKKAKDWSCTSKIKFQERLPRKIKKQIITFKNLDYPFMHKFLTIKQKLWIIQGIQNPNYNRFLIKLICEFYNNKSI